MIMSSKEDVERPVGEILDNFKTYLIVPLLLPKMGDFACTRECFLLYDRVS